VSDESNGLPQPPATSTAAMTGAEWLAARAALPVHGLRLYGTNHPRWFRGGEPAITMGRAPHNMLVIADESVSKEHAVMQRDGGATWIEDRNSANGTYVEDARQQRFQIAPGSIFRVGRVHMVAIDEALEDLRTRFQRYLGYGSEYQRAVDDALFASTRRSHALIYEPPGGGVTGLAKLFHEAGGGGAWPYLTIAEGTTSDEATQRELLKRAKMGTLVVSDPKWLAKAAILRAALAKRTHNVRLVAVMRRGAMSEMALGAELRSKVVAVEVPSLNERGPVEISKVVEAVAAEVGAQIGAPRAGLTREDGIQLLSQKWKHNYDDVEHDVRTVALVRMLGNNEAAVRLGYKSAGALSEWMRRRGFR
jgi:hypothetical protein